MAYRVILGDPSYSAQKAVQTAFPESEFEVYPFDNGQDVLDNIVRVQPDAVLLSLSLPGRDGYEVGRLLRNLESYKRVPLIFLKGVFEHLDPEKGAWIAEEDIVQKLGQLNRKYGKPILVGTMGGPYTQRMAKAIEAVGVPVFQSISDWVGAARGLAYHTMKLSD